MIFKRCRPDNYRDEVPLQKLVLVFKMLLMQSCLHDGKYDYRFIFLEPQGQKEKKKQDYKISLFLGIVVVHLVHHCSFII